MEKEELLVKRAKKMADLVDKVAKDFEKDERTIFMMFYHLAEIIPVKEANITFTDFNNLIDYIIDFDFEEKEAIVLAMEIISELEYDFAPITPEELTEIVKVNGGSDKEAKEMIKLAGALGL